jgi:hypothetical protein
MNRKESDQRTDLERKIDIFLWAALIIGGLTIIVIAVVMGKLP